MINNKKGKIETEKDLGDVYFLKIGRIRYLKSKYYKKNCCQICGKKRKTTAHHIIPKRLRCVCPFLYEIRVRVCSECDEMFHPENKFIKESVVVKKQSENISNLQDAVYWRSNKIRSIMKGLNKLSEDINVLSNLKDEDFYKEQNNKMIKKDGLSTKTFHKVKGG